MYFSHTCRPVEARLTLKGRSTFFCKQCEIFRCNFLEKTPWKIHIEMVAAKAFRTFLRIYLLLKSEPLSINTLPLYKAFIRFIMTYTSSTRDFAARSHLLKWQRLHNNVLRTIGNLPRRTLARDFHEAFKIPYIYNCYKTMQAAGRSHKKSCKCKYSQPRLKRSSTQKIKEA
jgi:hypothetical protein